MAESAKPERFSLSRWSRRKLAVAREREATAPVVDATGPAASATAPAPSPIVGAASAVGPATAGGDSRPPELPPVESLTIDSDFTAFLQPAVDEPVRRAALRKLFSDPQFNVMDGLDVYIDDYTKTTPIPDDVVRTLAHARYIFDPPRTRVNAQGFVEDVPEEDVANVTTSEERALDTGQSAADHPVEQPASVLGQDVTQVPVTDAPTAAEPAPAQISSLSPQLGVRDPVEPAQ